MITVDLSDWKSTKFPDGCVNPECRNEKPRHGAKGLCSSCYARWRAGELTLTEADAAPDPVDALDENPTREDLFGTGEPPNDQAPRERRPGSTGSPPAQDSAGAPSGSSDKTWKDKLLGPKEPRPKAPRGRRDSGADVLAEAYEYLGGIVVKLGHAPVGRYLTLQAPAAGQLLDEVASGTIVDRRLIQPAVKYQGKAAIVGALLGPPMLILALERNPENAEVLLPMLRRSIRNSLPVLLPAMKKVAAKEQKIDDAARELFDDGMIPPGVDPVDWVISQLFDGMVYAPADTASNESGVPG